MAVTCRANLLVALDNTLEDALDLTTAKDKLAVRHAIQLLNGTGTGQINEAFHDERTLGASATEDLDLAGSLVNPVGDTITFAKLKAIIVIADEDNTNDVQVSRPATNGVTWAAAASDKVSVGPGDVFVLTSRAGWTVTAGTADLITITNSAGTTGVTYKVILLGNR